MSAGAPDFFFREAKRLNYVARSAFKLLEIQKRHGIIRRGAAVLDLGCAPGAWLQVACQNLGPENSGGAVVGIDIKKVKVPAHYCDKRVQTLCSDVLKVHPRELAKLSPSGIGFSVILSDMCPSVSGISSRDAALSVELGMCTLSLALASNFDEGVPAHACSLAESSRGILLPQGSVVIKLLEGEDTSVWAGSERLCFVMNSPHLSKSGWNTSSELLQLCKPHFRSVTWLRPKATRSSSREIYLIAKGNKCNGGTL